MDSTEVLRQFAKVLHEFAGSILESVSAEPTEAEAQQADTEPEQTVEVEAQPPQEEKPLTLEEVRPILAEKSRAGHTEEIRELLKKHGAPNLSGIDPAEYPALLAEVEAL